MGKELITSYTSTAAIHEAPKERTEEAPKQDEAGKLLKELAKKKFPRPGKGTEQVELPQNKTSEAANPNGTNKGLASILRNLVNAIGGHHVGVFGCNNGAQGTRCNIEDNKIESKDSHHVGVFDCGNEYKKPNYFDISHLIIVCLVLLCFAMYKY
ncbi:uncharacterized protein LOC110772322 [Prunus avium]|uniref:Uncharacterized protein LOC110772322 n=1 Tax=Prunus avium TaxID=42229 RepID=A0A6P5TXE9_PRUAV|nr:uncharacterized protein LOC110772322 [Prunus avium]